MMTTTLVSRLTIPPSPVECSVQRPLLRRIGPSAIRSSRNSFIAPSRPHGYLLLPSLPRLAPTPAPTPKPERIRFVCLYKPKEELENASVKKDSSVSTSGWPLLERWEVPWDWPTASLTMFACGLSFTLTGAAEAILLPYLGFRIQDLTLDGKAELLFVGQLTATVAVLGVLFGITRTFKPFPDDIFRYDLKNPFDLRSGWLLWAGIGLVGGILAIALTGAVITSVNGETPQRETDALVRLLPLLGSSNVSTACLLAVTGILAPVLEETLFRGFLLVTLTRWVPTPVSIIISAAAFSLAHLTPSEFPQLFVLGTALGISYAQTRNLMAPITVHALWNSGIIILLTLLQLQGYDIRQLLQST